MSGLPVIETCISRKDPAQTFGDVLTATMLLNGILLRRPLYSETIRSSFRSCNTCFMLLYKLSKLVLSPLKCCTLATVKNSLQVYLNHHTTAIVVVLSI